jgi:ketosteroid isomerase-like protein
MTLAETVKSYYEAVESKDMSLLRELLAPDFSFEGPMMTFDGADAFIRFMESAPFEASHETIQMVSDDNSVAHVFLFSITAPAEAEVPMCEIFDLACEIFDLADGKIKSARLFFDTAKFPMPMDGAAA